MTAPEHGTLHRAVAALADPTTERIDRLATTPDHRQAIRNTNAEAARNHHDQISRYRRLLATHEARGDGPGARHILALIAHRETAYTAAAEARRTIEVAVPSLLAQLTAAVSSSSAGNRARGVHRSPLNTAAVELLADIRHGCGARHCDDLAETLRAWQPDDVPRALTDLHAWTKTALDIVDPPRCLEARGACPRCGEIHVWVREGDERIRKAAIQIKVTRDKTKDYAECVNPRCDGHWPRTHWGLLAAALRAG